MHILFLTDNFPPEVNAPASRTFEHCREWVKAGHRVTVITCVPNFPRGKVFAGYRNRLWQREEMEGISVIRVWSYITANEGFLRRTLDYVSFMPGAVLAALFVRRADVVIGTSPQFFTVCAAWLASALKRSPFVFELRDLWPESIKAVGAMKDGPALRLLERLELFLYRRARLVISVTQAFRQNLIDRGIEPDKIHVITNGVDLSRFCPQDKDRELVARYRLQGKFVAGYIGTHGMAHNLETLLEAARLLSGQAGGGDIRILLLGDGARKEAIVNRGREMALENVVFIDSVPKNEVVRYWSLLDAAIIHLRKTELFATVIPSKLFEAMGMGIPVLHGVEGESAAIVVKEQAGLTFEPENAEDLAGKIMTLRENKELFDKLRSSAHKAAHHFDRGHLALKMLSVIDREISNARQ